MDPAYARRIGVNIDDLLVSQPDNGEQALEIAELLIRSGALDVVAVDSVAALTPKAEIEGEMGDSHVGLQARLMSQALRKLAGTLNRTGTIALFTNQLREKIGVMFGNPETTPGRPRAEVLLLGAARHPPHRDAQGGRRGDRQPRPREGREEQGRAAVQAGRVRHHLRRRHLLGGLGARRRPRAEDRPEVGLVLQLRRRAARPGPPERDRLPARAPGRRRADPPRRPGGARARRGRVLAALAAERRCGQDGSKARAPRRRGRDGRAGRATRSPPPRMAAPGIDGAPAGAAGRVALELDGSRWRTVPDDVVVRCGPRARGSSSTGRSCARSRASSGAREALGAAGRACARATCPSRRLRRAPRARGRPRGAPRRRPSRARASRASSTTRGSRAARARALAERGWGDAAIVARLEAEGLAERDVEAALAEPRAGAGAGRAARRRDRGPAQGVGAPRAARLRPGHDRGGRRPAGRGRLSRRARIALHHTDHKPPASERLFAESDTATDDSTSNQTHDQRHREHTEDAPRDGRRSACAGAAARRSDERRSYGPRRRSEQC